MKILTPLGESLPADVEVMLTIEQALLRQRSDHVLTSKELGREPNPDVLAGIDRALDWIEAMKRGE
jgi:hypothetical protein